MVGRFRAYSAGSRPKGEVHPLAREVLSEIGVPIEGLRSKSWEEFARPDAPQMDFVITVCDNAAGEACPLWPGAPVTAHWGMPDPAAMDGDRDQRRRAFAETATLLKRRIELFSCLSLDRRDHEIWKDRISGIASDR